MSDLNKAITAITDPLLKIDSNASPDGLIIASLRRVLAEAGPRQADVLRACAIPRWFDLGVLAVLRGRDDGNERVLELLRGYSFVREPDEGRYAYQDVVRKALLDEWQAERPDELRAISQRLSEYFAERAQVAMPEQRTLPKGPSPFTINSTPTGAWELWSREALYHQLLADPSAGMTRLSAAFDQAESTYRLADAEALLQMTYDAQLSAGDRLRVRYMRARLERAALRLDEAYKQLDTLLGEPALDPQLAAEAQETLGDVLAEQGQWARAIELYRGCLSYFQQNDQAQAAARVMLRLGEAYQGIGSTTGGWHVAAIPPSGLGHALGQAWYWLLSLSFYLVAAFLRRTPWTLPRPRYVAAYENWLLIRIYRTAQDWYGRALAAFAALADDDGRLRVEQQRAQILLLFDYTDDALAQLDALRARPAAQDIDRRAWIDSLRAAALHERGNTEEAQAILVEALARFREIGDMRGEAIVLALQGRIAAAAGAVEQALSGFETSLARFRTLGYAAAREQVLYALRAWRRMSGPGEVARRVAALLEAEPEKRYVGRFPRRQIPLLQALMLAAIPLGLLLSTLVAPTEVVVRVGNSPLVDSQITYNLWNVLGALIATGLLSLAVYTLSALAVIFFIPLASLEREQPDYLITDSAGISRYDFRGELAQRMRWEDIRRWIRVDREIWQRPLRLFSSTFIETADGRDLRIDGITGWYSGLQEDIGLHLRDGDNPTRSTNLGFTILRSKMGALLILGVVLLLLFISVENRWADWLLLALPTPLYVVLAMIVFSGILMLIPFGYWFAARPLALVRMLDLRSRWTWAVGAIGLGAIVVSLGFQGRWLLGGSLSVALLIWGAYLLGESVYTLLLPNRRMLGRALVVAAILIAGLLAYPIAEAVYDTGVAKTCSKRNDCAPSAQAVPGPSQPEKVDDPASLQADGNAYYQQDQYTEAEQAYTEALRQLIQEPETPGRNHQIGILFYNRALARFHLGDQRWQQDLKNACALVSELCQLPKS